jgi:acetyltransferase-like isoleucine patch superfamily enzyme
MSARFARFRGFLFAVRCLLFKRNTKVGKGLTLYRRLRVRGTGKIYIGNNCTIGGAIGDRSQYTTIFTHSPEAIVRIGDDTSLYAARISAKYEILIGNDVLIEEAGILDTDFHSIDKTRSEPDGETKERCRIVIGDRVSIGARSFVMKGVVIGTDVIVTPGSVITTSAIPNTIIGGNPAKSSALKYRPVSPV